MDNFLVLTVIAVILTAVIAYIRREKKKGIRCIGCPDSGNCSGNCNGCKGCGTK